MAVLYDPLLGKLRLKDSTAVGGTVSGGTPNTLLYLDSSGNLASSTSLGANTSKGWIDVPSPNGGVVIGPTGGGSNDIESYFGTTLRLGIAGVTSWVLGGSVGTGLYNHGFGDNVSPTTARMVVRGKTADSTDNIFDGQDSGSISRFLIRNDGVITVNGSVGIGVTPSFPLDIVQTSSSSLLSGGRITLNAGATGAVSSSGLQITNHVNGQDGSSNTAGNVAVKALTDGTTGLTNYGGQFIAQDGFTNIGFYASGTSLNHSGNSVDIGFIANAYLVNFGSNVPHGYGAIIRLNDTAPVFSAPEDAALFLDSGNKSSSFLLIGKNLGVSKMCFDLNGNLGIGTTSPTAFADLAASTTSRATLRIRSGSAPTSPNDGDIWYDGSDFRTQMGGASKIVVLSAYVAKTANYTLTAADYLVDCTSNTFTVTLPTAVGITGRMYKIKNSGTGVITIGTTSSQTIDGSTTQTLSTQYASYTVMSNGSNWIIV